MTRFIFWGNSQAWLVRGKWPCLKLSATALVSTISSKVSSVTQPKAKEVSNQTFFDKEKMMMAYIKAMKANFNRRDLGIV